MSSFKLPRLPLNWREQPQLFERYWNDAMANIEKSINGILELPGIKDSIQVAQDTADTAQTDSNLANSKIDAQTSELSLANSYIDSSSYVGSLISVTSTGDITVKTHTRVYGDSSLNPPVTVIGNTFNVSGTTAGDIYRVYYIDTARTGGTVSYLVTKDPAPSPVQAGNTHSVGAVVVPVSGTADGISLQPPGYVFF